MRIWLGATMVVLWFVAASGSAAQSKEIKRIVDPRDVIALEEGVWDAVITVWPRTSDEEPTTARGVQVNELRSGGLWMLNRMSANGGAYDGTGVWGHDPKTGRFSGIWVDNGSTRIRMDDGSWDPESNTMTWVAEIERPDGRKLRMRATSTFVGNTRTYRSYTLTDPGWVLRSTVIFTRRLKSPARR